MAVTAKTKLLGLLGWPLAHSLSPAMHNAAARALRLDLLYVPLPVAPQQLPAAVQGLAALGFLGANVTVPHKEAIIPYLSGLDSAAQAIGAVNTLVLAGEAGGPEAPAFRGTNTDHAGFAADLQQQGIAVAGRPCLVLGAGGSARAVAYALARGGAEVTVYARRLPQAKALVAALAPHAPAGALHVAAWGALPAAARQPAALVVNTTPLGMHPHVEGCPWPADLPFPPGAAIYDLIYNPAETRLMRQARAAGRRAVNGRGMLLRQGALAFALWTGQQPPLDVMAAALD